MSHFPLFSVVIPTYNRANLIDDTISSVLAQSVQDFEIIVVDDCSEDQDALRNVLESYNDKRITLIVHDQNRNGAAARNSGMKRAKGKFIAFLDSDDVWPINRLSVIKQKIDETEDINDKIFYGQVDFKFPEEEQGEIKPGVGIVGNRVDEYLFVEGGLIQTSTIVCLREIALDIAFDERFKRHQDYDFCIRAGHEGYKFEFIPTVLSHWIRIKGTSTFNKGATFDFCSFWIEAMSPYMQPKGIKAYKSKILAPIAFECGHFSKGVLLLSHNIASLNRKSRLKAIIDSMKGVAKFFLRRVR